MATLESGPGKTYTDIAAAYAAGSSGDQIEDYNEYQELATHLTGKAISIRGMLPNRQCHVRCTTTLFYWLYGNLVGDPQVVGEASCSKRGI